MRRLTLDEAIGPGPLTHSPYERWMAEGSLIEVSADVLEIGRRAAEGDELWRGDPTAALCFNPMLNPQTGEPLVDPSTGDTIPGRFEIWLIDATGRRYCAVTHDKCDQTLLVKLAEGDWRRDSDEILAKIMAHNAELDAKRNAAVHDRIGELADRIHWALLRDTPTEGNTRRLYAVGAPGGSR